MSMPTPKPLFQQIYDWVRQIPPGRVTTYGQIARLVGNPRLSRVVGYALHSAPEGVPCHRVVNREGGLSDAFCPMGKETHRLLLEMDGTPLNPDGTVDMEMAFWSGLEA